MQRHTRTINSYKDAERLASEFAHNHINMARSVAQAYTDNPERNQLYRNADSFHWELYNKLASLSTCLFHYSKHQCHPKSKQAEWDNIFKQLNIFIEQFQYWERSLWYSTPNWAVELGRWVEKEYQFINDLTSLEQWLVRPDVVSFDSSAICPANVEVDDVFYDCPVGADETQVFQSQATVDESFFDVDTLVVHPALSFDAIKQNIKSSAIHGATATFIIEMVGYCSKRAGCSDRAVNIISTSAGVAIAIYAGSYLSTVAYAGTKQLALCSGLSERDAGRVALVVETGVRVARNFTLPGIIETGVSMTAAFGGSYAGSAVSFFARKGLDMALPHKAKHKDIDLLEVKLA